MRLKRSNILFLTFLFILSGLQAKQNDSMSQNSQFDKVYWEKLVDDKQFEEDEIHRSKSIPKRKLKNNDLNLPEPIKYAILGLALLTLVLAMFYIIKMSKSKKEQIFTKTVHDFDVEQLELIDYKVFEKEIKKYVEEEEFRLAFRWRFLQLLKQMEAKNLIQYGRDKTNSIYLKELKGKQGLCKEFGIICKQFDPIWYGEKPMNRLEYESMNEVFDNCLKLI